MAGNIVTYTNGKLYIAKYANPGYNPTISTYFWAVYNCPTTAVPSVCRYASWIEGGQYAAGNIVLYTDGKLYIANYANPGYNPTISTYYWAPYNCNVAVAPAPAPKPNYVAIPMSIEVNKSAKDVWAKVGGWCDISNWITPTGGVPCVVTSGTGEVGSVRVIAGRVTEVMTAKSEFGYGYTQPNVEGKWYNLYHGFMEVRPVTATTSKIYYTLMQDMADKADQAAIDKDVATRLATSAEDMATKLGELKTPVKMAKK